MPNLDSLAPFDRVREDSMASQTRPTEPRPVSQEVLGARVERLRKIGLPEIGRDLGKLTLRGKEVRISRRSHPKHYFDVKVENLHQLKHLVGNVDRSLETNGMREHLPFPMHAHEVPDGRLTDFAKLSPIEQRSVVKAAKNIVYGHSQALGLDDARLTALQEWVLENGRVIPVFAGTDLEVMDGTTAVLNDAAVMYFHTITVHGSGSIKLENAIKIFTDEMRVVP
jgi:hypothetical protein